MASPVASSGRLIPSVRQLRIAVTFDLIDINDRGDRNFDALNEIEKDLYVLQLFDSLLIMEGVRHFLTHHIEKLLRLLNFLATIEAPNESAIRSIAGLLTSRASGPWDSDTFDECFPTDEGLDELNALQDAYYAETQEMWSCAREYVQQKYGAQIS